VPDFLRIGSRTGGSGTCGGVGRRPGGFHNPYPVCFRKGVIVRDLAQVRAAFDEMYGPGGQVRAFFAPGRVNLIGDHIDYSGGQVLPLALDRGTLLLARLRDDSLVRGASLDLPEKVEAALDHTEYRDDLDWFAYVLGVVHVLAGDGYRLERGLDIMIAGDIPNGAGLSSSASVEMAAAVALRAYGGFDLDATNLALIAQRAENEYVGVACGIMDQLAIARGVRAHALLMDCGTLQVDPVPFPHDELGLIVINTNHRRALADSAYNDRRAAVERASRVLGVSSLVHADLAAVESAELSAEERRRARHTVTEQARVVAAADALRSGDYRELGRLMRQSHESLRDDFQVTGSQLDALAEAAWQQPGVIGARMTGAGFGGCVVVIAEPESVDDVIAGVSQEYERATGLQPTGMVMGSDDGARELEVMW